VEQESQTRPLVLGTRDNPTVISEMAPLSIPRRATATARSLLQTFADGYA
jgi:hypothetical protein